VDYLQSTVDEPSGRLLHNLRAHLSTTTAGITSTASTPMFPVLDTVFHKSTTAMTDADRTSNTASYNGTPWPTFGEPPRRINQQMETS